MEKDFYKELGVASDASASDIRKAYRKLANELHPDKNPGDTAAEERFKRVSEANSVLSDPEKKKDYDETRTMFAGGRFRGGNGFPGGFGGGTGNALFFAPGFVGLDLLVNRAFKREDFTLDALGFSVDQARALQGRRLQFLALALKA